MQFTFLITVTVRGTRKTAPTDEQLVGQMAMYVVQRNTDSISEVVGPCTGAGKLGNFYRRIK
jgi:hypothetical protein